MLDMFMLHHLYVLTTSHSSHYSHLIIHVSVLFVFLSVCLTATSNACSPSPCLNGATCVNEANGFSCTCVDGFTGDTCQTLSKNVKFVTATQICKELLVRMFCFKHVIVGQNLWGPVFQSLGKDTFSVERNRDII